MDVHVELKGKIKIIGVSERGCRGKLLARSFPCIFPPISFILPTSTAPWAAELTMAAYRAR